MRVEIGGVEVSLRLTKEKDRGKTMLLRDWLAFSAAEQGVLKILVRGVARTREQLAREMEESADGKLKILLANLVLRKVIIVTDDGYAVNAPASKLPGLRTWFEAEQVEEES